MTPYYQDDQTTVYHGDCIEVMRNMPENSVDAIVTDPPYGLGFMGAKWDALPPGKDWAEECLRVLKPGGHLLAFGGTRTWHRLAVAIEDAGFEIRDSVMWLYGSGFPKSHDVSKAIDKQRDDYPAIREVVMFIRAAFAASGADRSQLDDALGGPAVMAHFLAPSRSNAGCPTWDQWQTLKTILRFDDSMDTEVWRLNGRKGTPGEAWEKREVVGRTKGAQAESTGRYGAWGNDRGDGISEYDLTTPATPEAQQWSGWGTALKPANEPIVMARKPFKLTVAANVLEHGTGAINIDACRINPGEVVPGGGNGKANHGGRFGAGTSGERPKVEPHSSGRWPANVILDEHMAGVLDQQSGVSKSQNRVGKRTGKDSGVLGAFTGQEGVSMGHTDSGGASRFFYVSKAPKRERPEVNGVKHATVKPLTLMRYLVRMVTPPNGIVLDPFAGSGTTIEAALLEGFQSIGIELTEEYLPLIQQRIKRQWEAAVGGPMTDYHVCDHPELLVKDEICVLCDQIDGQTDALNEVAW